ncbi:MAG: dienelactone hydrolase family protein [Myxococcota bacterium]|nr:dienelactone hydrolase family protein [Myxococcota bacterium]
MSQTVLSFIFSSQKLYRRRTPILVSLGVLCVFEAGCALQAHQGYRKAAPVAGRSAVLMAHGLGPRSDLLAYGANLPDGARAEVFTNSVSNRKDEFIFRGRVVDPRKTWMLVSAGAISSASSDSQAEYWRQGQYQVETSVEEKAVDSRGRVIVGPQDILNLQVKLGPARFWPVRRDSYVVSLYSIPEGTTPISKTSTNSTHGFRRMTTTSTNSGRFEASSAQLKAAYNQQFSLAGNSEIQDAEFRALLGVNSPKLGFRKSNQESGGFIIEDWSLPTPFGTEGHMRIVRTSSVNTPLPAVIYFCGHFNGGIRHPDVSRFLLETAKNGYVAAAVDLLGYGYRQGPESAHVLASYLTLLGRPAIRPFLEEAEAALETMLRLPFVKPEQITVTGISMGGTIAMLLAALRSEIKGVVSMGGTADFEAFARPIGSDSEQHFIGFQAMGGFAGLTHMISPRPLSLIFPKDDGDHGKESNRGVVTAGEQAYSDTPEKFRSFVGLGKHEQSADSRRDIIQEINHQNYKSDFVEYAGKWLPAVEPRYREFTGLKTQISRMFKMATTKRKPSKDNVYVPPKFSTKVSGMSGPQQTEVVLTLEDELASTLAWRFAVNKPVERVLLIEDSGRLASGFAPLMQACGFDVTVLQLPTFGTSGSDHQAWHRKLLSLLSVSVNKSLASSWVSHLSAAVLAFGEFDRILTFGPESGALALLAYAEGALVNPNLVMADAPQTLKFRFEKGYAPYWTSLSPGILQELDFDDVVNEVRSQGRISIVSGGEGLGLPETSNRHPVINRAKAIQILLEKHDLLQCIRPLPVVQVRQ